MANLPDVKFTISSNGLGRPLDGKDHYSGMPFYTASYPSGFSVTNKINKVFSLADVEALGIKGDYSSEIKATGGNYALSVTSATNGDAVEFKVTALGKTISLGIVTWITGMTPTTFAAAARVAINTLTTAHGFVAGGSVGNVLLTAAPGYGVNINGGSALTAIVTGTVTAPTITQFASGVNDPFINIWYQAKRYFLRQPKGILWLGIFPSTGTIDFAEITTMQNFASGEIRLFGVYSNINDTSFAQSQVTALQSVANVLYDLHTPIDIIYTPNIYGTALGSLVDISAFGCKDVVIDIGQDGGNMGAKLGIYLGRSIGSLGALLGTAALASVSDNLGWVAKYNVAVDDAEFAIPAFSNGTLYRDQPASLINSLYSYQYTFLKTHIGITGTYFVDAKTATVPTSDYCTLENNRTIKKAIRNVRASILPQLSGPIYVDATTGKLTNETIGYLESLANAPIEQMEKDGELSGHKVIINPNQDVLSTSNIVMTILNVPVGVSRTFNINIGYVTKV